MRSVSNILWTEQISKVDKELLPALGGTGWCLSLPPLADMAREELMNRIGEETIDRVADSVVVSLLVELQRIYGRNTFIK
jgi:hypothetical protein